MKQYQSRSPIFPNLQSNKLLRSDFLYQAYYCEENIWHLCQNPAFSNSYVVFIASRGDAFPMLCQRAMPDPGHPILWDYHVVLLFPGTPYQIVDFDTTLPFNSNLTDYLKHSFPDEQRLHNEYVPLFRVISANEYIALFSSDRSHMKTENGWSAPPPDWPMINHGGNNLHKFTDMNDSEFGEIYTQRALLLEYS